MPIWEWENLHLLKQILKNRKHLKFNAFKQFLVYRMHDLFNPKLHCFEISHTKQYCTISKFRLKLPQFNDTLHRTTETWWGTNRSRSALTITLVIWNSFKYVRKLNNMDCDYKQNSFRFINLTWFCHIIFTITKTLSFKCDHFIKGPIWNLKRNSRTQKLRFRYLFIYNLLCMYHVRWVQYGPVHPFVQLGQLNEVLLVHMDSILQFSVQKFLQLSNPFWDGKHAMGKNQLYYFFLF